MQKTEVKFSISSFNKIPYGISISLLKSLVILKESGFKVNYVKFKELLKNFKIFSNCSNLSQYIYYVFKKSIEYAPKKLEINTSYGSLIKNCENCSDMLISLKEYELMQRIYIQFINSAIYNVVNDRETFLIDVDLDPEEIYELYPDIEDENEKVETFKRVFTGFCMYNGFIICKIKCNFLNCKKTKRIIFYESLN